MRGDVSFAVVDTSIILSVFMNEPDRIEASEYLLDNDQIKLVLPALARLEILAHAQTRSAQSLNPVERKESVKQAEEKIEALHLLPADASSRVMRIAAQLIPQCNIKAPDAVIVATALAFGIPFVYTWDQKLIRACSTLDRVAVLEPPLPSQASLVI